MPPVRRSKRGRPDDEEEEPQDLSKETLQISAERPVKRQRTTKKATPEASAPATLKTSASETPLKTTVETLAETQDPAGNETEAAVKARGKAKGKAPAKGKGKGRGRGKAKEEEEEDQVEQEVRDQKEVKAQEKVGEGQGETEEKSEEVKAEEKKVEKKVEKKAEKAVDVKAIADQGAEKASLHEVSLVRSHVKKALTTGATSHKLVGYEDNKATLFNLLERTLVSGESNSVLLIGNRGIGKTMLVNDVLRDLKANYHHQNKPFLEIRLDGMIHTTDQVAMREICKQLSLEQELEERSFSSFTEGLTFLLGLVKKGNKETLPIIFVLDEFDAFAQHPKQNLLYNLFDMVQANPTPIGVLGISTRIDAVELLEKRVKSRFSHRQILLSSAETFGDFQKVIKATLTIPENLTPSAYARDFNASLEQLFEDPLYLEKTQRIYEFSKEYRNLFRCLYTAACKLTPQQPFLQASDIVGQYTLQAEDTKVQLLQSVSILELTLLIAMKKLLEKEMSTFNFEMVYHEYQQLGLKTDAHLVDIYSKPVALKSFDHLLHLEVLQPTSLTSKLPKEFKLMRLLLDEREITDAVMQRADCPTVIRKWGTSWIE